MAKAYCKNCKHSKIILGGLKECPENYFCFHSEKIFIDPVLGIVVKGVPCYKARMTNGYCSNGELFEKKIK